MARPPLSRRSCGILLHPTSLPGPHGTGDLGPAAHRFLDFLKDAGQTWWQTLPVGPVGPQGCPYQAPSAFAGGPHLVSLELLAAEGLLAPEEIAPPPGAGLRPDRVDYAAVERFKAPLLRLAARRFEEKGGRRRAPFRRFLTRGASWLGDFALFVALKRAQGGAPWTDWPSALRARDPAALAKAREDHAAAIRAEEFVQFAFERQWSNLRRAAAARGIGLIGDVPIYVAHDGADVWSRPEIFRLDAEGRPTEVAGVPPDYFAREGQRWGNPLYRWDALKRRGYDFWVARLRHDLFRFDVLRLDHFIGFHRFYAIPASAETAKDGRFEPGPGDHFFRVLKQRLGSLPFIAEDLGLLIPEVEALRDRFGLPGMKVLQFAFADPGRRNPHRPEFHAVNSVIYTGTHDNPTAAGWFAEPPRPGSPRSAEMIRQEREFARAYLMTDARSFPRDLVRLAYASRANTAIIPLPDVLGLGDEARMNTPGTVEGNWGWRFDAASLAREAALALRSLAEETARVPGGGRIRRQPRRGRA